MTLPESSIPRQSSLNFYDFVANTDFPEDFKKSFSKAVIVKVEISTREKVWRIHLEAAALLSKQLLHSLAERLGAEIPGLRELLFEVRYRFPQTEFASVITNYRDELVFALSRQHPILYSWLNSAAWRIDGSNLIIKVKNDLGIEILNQKKGRLFD